MACELHFTHPLLMIIIDTIMCGRPSLPFSDHWSSPRKKFDGLFLSFVLLCFGSVDRAAAASRGSVRRAHACFDHDFFSRCDYRIMTSLKLTDLTKDEWTGSCAGGSRRWRLRFSIVSPFAGLRGLPTCAAICLHIFCSSCFDFFSSSLLFFVSVSCFVCFFSIIGV